MRRVSMKRKSARRSGRAEKEYGSDDSHADNEASVDEDYIPGSVQENGDGETPEKRRRSDKRKSGSAKKKSKKEEESDAEDGVQYEVESVLDEKFIKGVKHYLIRWKGYTEDSDTWEPESTLNCEDLIKAFHEKNATGPKSPKKEKHSSKHKRNSEGKIKSKDIRWSENEEFEVDRILEVHHKRDGTREFLVSWKGFPSTENSWEPEANMTCSELIAKFMNKVEKAKESDSRVLREHRSHTNRFTLMANASGRRLSRRNLGKQRVQYHDAE